MEQKKDNKYIRFSLQIFTEFTNKRICLPEKFYVSILAHVLLTKEAENENILFQQN